MGIITWLKDFFSGETIPLSGADLNIALDEYSALIADIYIREMAFWSAVNLVANAVSKCEFKTYEKGKEVKGKEYYLWNIEPNQNQNSSGFIHKWISQLYRKNECLIIEQNDKLLVADSFTRTPYALFDDVFTQVTVGEFSFNRSFAQTDVLYYNMWNVVAGNAKELRKAADDLDTIMEGNRQAYLQKAGDKLDEKKLIELLDAETWLTAEQCIEFGLADEYAEKEADLTQAKQMLQKVNLSMTQRIEYNKSLAAQLRELAETKEQPVEPITEPIAEPSQELETKENKTLKFFNALMGGKD